MTPQDMKAELKALGAVVEGRLSTVFGDGATPAHLVADSASIRVHSRFKSSDHAPLEVVFFLKPPGAPAH